MGGRKVAAPAPAPALAPVVVSAPSIEVVGLAGANVIRGSREAVARKRLHSPGGAGAGGATAAGVRICGCEAGNGSVRRGESKRGGGAGDSGGGDVDAGDSGACAGALGGLVAVGGLAAAASVAERVVVAAGPANSPEQRSTFVKVCCLSLVTALS